MKNQFKKKIKLLKKKNEEITKYKQKKLEKKK